MELTPTSRRVKSAQLPVAGDMQAPSAASESELSDSVHVGSRPNVATRVLSAAARVPEYLKVATYITAGLSSVLLPLVEYEAKKWLTYPFSSARQKATQPPFVEWMQKNHPRNWQMALDPAVKLTSTYVERSMGMSVSEFLEAEQSLQRLLTPVNGPQGKELPGLMWKLAFPAARYGIIADIGLLAPQESERLLKDLEGYSRSSSFVFLGDDRAKAATQIMEKFDRTLAPSEQNNPYHHTPLENVWNQLVAKARDGQMPVFVDLDHDLEHESASESIVSATIASLGQRKNEFGNDASNQKYYRQRAAEFTWYHSHVDPWLAHADPERHQALQQIKHFIGPISDASLQGFPSMYELQARWPDNPMFWRADAARVGEAYSIFRNEAMPAGKAPSSNLQRCAFADMAISLDQDIQSGVQSCWIRFLKEIGPDRRAPVLEALAKTWVQLNLAPPDDALFDRVSPAGAPSVPAGADLTMVPYDRSLLLRKVVEHTINGLGLDERGAFIDELHAQLRNPTNAAKLLQREAQIKIWEPQLDSVNALEHLNAPAATSDGDAQRLLDLEQALEKTGREQRKDSTRYRAMARHLDMLQWMVGRGERYGEANSQLDAEALSALGGSKDGSIPLEAQSRPNLFQGGPFAIGEFYQDQGGTPTPLRAGPNQVEYLGEGEREVRLSFVVKGGGGKGLAFSEPLLQIKQALAASKNCRFAIDEYVGTSAGALTAGLLAAGYTPDELVEVMRELNPKRFYSDYMWEQGGVDPKVRGINRDGMFSTQEMYLTLYRKLADKLGIHGRPITFRDLPFKLKIVSTVLSTDLPDDHPIRKLIGKDGQIEFSDENTPNFDVVAAMVGSSSIPVFFDSPQLHVGDAPGNVSTPYRLQLMDGGVVNNFPVGVASHAREGKTGLAILPVQYLDMSTLEFAPPAKVMDGANGANRTSYQTFMNPLVATMQQAVEERGYTRFAVGLNLANIEEQSAPVLQGTTAADSDELRQLAARRRMPLLSAQDTDKLISQNLPGPSALTWVARHLLTWMMDNQELVMDANRYHVPYREAQNLDDVLLGAGAAMIHSRTYRPRFEQAG